MNEPKPIYLDATTPEKMAKTFDFISERLFKMTASAKADRLVLRCSDCHRNCRIELTATDLIEDELANCACPFQPAKVGDFRRVL